MEEIKKMVQEADKTLFMIYEDQHFRAIEEVQRKTGDDSLSSSYVQNLHNSVENETHSAAVQSTNDVRFQTRRAIGPQNIFEFCIVPEPVEIFVSCLSPVKLPYQADGRDRIFRRVVTRDSYEEIARGVFFTVQNENLLEMDNLILLSLEVDIETAFL